MPKKKKFTEKEVLGKIDEYRNQLSTYDIE